jgi:hypothetical protein
LNPLRLWSRILASAKTHDFHGIDSRGHAPVCR